MILMRTTRRTGMAVWLRAVAAAVLVVAALPSQVAAECVVIAPAEREEGAGLVFSGSVTAVQVLSGGRRIIDFGVERVWKGRVNPRTRLYYHIDSIDTLVFEKGGRYLVFAPTWGLLEFFDARRKAIDEPRNSCGWGMPLDGEAHDLDTTLGRGRRP